MAGGHLTGFQRRIRSLGSRLCQDGEWPAEPGEEKTCRPGGGSTLLFFAPDDRGAGGLDVAQALERLTEVLVVELRALPARFAG